MLFQDKKEVLPDFGFYPNKICAEGPLLVGGTKNDPIVSTDKESKLIYFRSVCEGYNLQN